MIRISNFNTLGLTGSDKTDEINPWTSLIYSDGISDKDLSSGGSYGIGKSAIFACSMLRTVFYSTLDIDSKKASQGVSKLIRYGDVLNIIQADERNRIVERNEVPLFENDAFREAVINAFVHNKWISGNEPMITVFSDRIEILSRGSFAPEQTMEGFFAGESIPVNKKLSEIFLQLHISEKTGRGVPKITQKYGKEAYEFRENSIVVRIPFSWINVMGDKVGDKTDDKFSNHSLNNTQARILAEIRNNSNVTKQSLCEILKVGKTTIDNGIAALKKYGYIERKGSNKTGYWKILR